MAMTNSQKAGAVLIVILLMVVVSIAGMLGAFESDKKTVAKMDQQNQAVATEQKSVEPVGTGRQHFAGSKPAEMPTEFLAVVAGQPVAVGTVGFASYPAYVEKNHGIVWVDARNCSRLYVDEKIVIKIGAGGFFTYVRPASP